MWRYCDARRRRWRCRRAFLLRSLLKRRSSVRGARRSFVRAQDGVAPPAVFPALLREWNKYSSLRFPKSRRRLGTSKRLFLREQDAPVEQRFLFCRKRVVELSLIHIS